MNTEILTIDQFAPNLDTICLAANLIRTGRLVAFPTETVYGLGANALDSTAVRGIFAAKGRPSSNPLIVHVADSIQVLNVAREWPETAVLLASRFWPGPLTIVVPKRSEVPDEVTAGGPTVAVRCPNHAVAQSLIRAAKVPIAAPSANRSTELSPTRAEHVLKGLAGRIDLILDGGSCPGGIESTVVDVTGNVAQLLRPGLVSMQMLEGVIGKVEVGGKSAGVSRSPGQMARHYSPRTKLRLIHGENLIDDLLEAIRAGLRVGVLTFSWNDAPWAKSVESGVSYFNLSDNPELAATQLYDTLHRLDQEQLDLILVEEPPRTPEWAAIRDRLARAAVLDN
jgi:L-threonylcarbamoyladenylate synthase